MIARSITTRIDPDSKKEKPPQSPSNRFKSKVAPGFNFLALKTPINEI